VTSIFAYESSIKDFEQVRKGLSPAKLEAFRFFCVVTRGFGVSDSLANVTPGNSPEHTIRRFASCLLQCIEEEAATRKEYSVAEWLLD
jgi:hypothetical protein